MFQAFGELKYSIAHLPIALIETKDSVGCRHVLKAKRK